MSKISSNLIPLIGPCHAGCKAVCVLGQHVAHAITPVRNEHLDRLGEFGIGLRLVDRTVNDQRLIRLVCGDRPCQGMRAVEQRITDTVSESRRAAD